MRRKRHQSSDWLRTKQTQELIAELEKAVPGIPGTEQNQPLRVYQGGNGAQGTFVCKELVYAYAMWISATFHLRVIRVFDAQVTKPPVDPMQVLKKFRSWAFRRLSRWES